MSKNTNNIFYTTEREIYYNSLKRKPSNFNIDKNINLEVLNDFQLFVSTYFKHYTKSLKGEEIKLSKYHLELINELNNDKVEILAEFSRGFAKSTVFSLFAPIYFMLKGDIHMCLLISSTKDAAVKQLINLQSEFENNLKLINDFGPFVNKGTWAKGNFIIEKYDCQFACAGKGQSIRGLKHKSYRLDFCICDDIDDDVSCRNKEIIKYQFDWLLQNAFSALELNKYKFLVVGNKFSDNSIIDKVSKIDGIKHIRVNALDVNNKSNWEERYSTNDLLRIKDKIGNTRFQREYQNTPIIEGSIFKEETIVFKPIEEYNKYEYIISYLDPSYKAQSDFKSVVTLGYINNEYHILDIFLKQCSMQVVIEYLYELNDKLLNCAYSMYYEANFSQDLHQLEFDRIANIKGFSLPIRQDKTPKENKIARIESMNVIFETGRIYINCLIIYSLDFKEFKEQLITFPFNKHDDGPDSLQSAYVFLNQKVRQSKFDPMIGSRESLQYNHY